MGGDEIPRRGKRGSAIMNLGTLKKKDLREAWKHKIMTGEQRTLLT
jgi:hypothetical protein